MNLTHKKPLVVAIAASLGLMSPMAWASLVDLSKSDSAVNIWLDQAKESNLTVASVAAGTVPTTSTTIGNSTGYDLTVLIPNIPSGYKVSQQEGKILTIRLTLSSGATFTQTGAAKGATLVCASGSDSTYAKSAVDITWSDIGGGAAAIGATPALAGDKNTLLFALPDTFTTVKDGCLLTFSAALPYDATVLSAVDAIKTVGTSDVKLTSEVTYQELFQNKTVTAVGTIIKFATAINGSVSTKTTSGVAADPVIDVKYASQKFVKQGIDDLQKVVLGSVSAGYVYTTNVRLASGGSLTAFDGSTTNRLLSGGVTITLTGPTLAAASKVSLYTGTCAGTKIGTDAVPVVSAAATSGAAAVGSVTLTVAAASIPALASGLNVCMEVNGTTMIPDGQITASLQGLRVEGSKISDLGTGNLASVRRNGVVLRVLNIPNSTSADQPFIRFYNTSAQDIKVIGTLYGQDGKAIGTAGATLFDALKSHDVEILDAAKLQSKVSATAPWTGRAWLMVQAETAPELLKVQALIRSPTGILINLSTDAVD